jgi:RNA polymerase sigma-70 factor (ECF subfamily)
MATDKVELQKIAILVDRFKEGDEEAFRELVFATQNKLFKTCYFITSNNEQAEDLTQETFVKVYKKLKELDDSKLFLGWMYRIAKNCFLDQLKLNEAKIEKGSASLVLLEDDKAKPEHDLHDLRVILNEFEEADRLLITLIELEEFSYAEAAQVFESTEDSIRSRIARLRKSLREKWLKKTT